MASEMTPINAIARTPTAYADQLAQVAVGPHISRLVFAVETSVEGQSAMSLTIVLPTPRLLDLANHLQQMLNDPELKKNLVKDYETSADVVRASMQAG